VSIELSNGQTFTIQAKNYSKDHKYIQSARLNGQEWNKPWFSHTDIQQGGVLELIMGKTANHQWGTSPKDAPPSLIYD
ncbi:MAG TPA: glycoside hydrolase domain-containing protein, partial [Daejeonella sp.]|nr:glycoside hydrolase domain-containing protein [Daejeonella sp.]